MLVDRHPVGIAIRSWNRTHAAPQRYHLPLRQAPREAIQALGQRRSFPSGPAQCCEALRFAYRFDGKQKLLALGAYPAISLLDARLKRDAAKKLLADGSDPSVERKAERRAAQLSRRNTFKAVADELMVKFEAEGDASTTLKKKRWLLDFANKEFGKRPIAEIKAPEILEALRKIEKRGRHETATRVRSTVGAVFRYAIATGRAERIHHPTSAAP